MSRIPKISKINMRSIENLPPLPTHFANLPKRGNIRRSKSFSDLRTARLPFSSRPITSTATQAPATGVKQKPPVTKTTPPVSSTQVKATKRPAPTTAGSAPKKVAKKIPDWDYKTRFLMLKETHTKIVDEHKKLVEETKTVHDQLSEKAQICLELKNNNEALNLFKTEAEKEKAMLREQILGITEENSKLLNMLKVESKKCEELLQNNNLLSESQRNFETENISLKQQMLSLRNTVENSEDKITRMKEENSQLESEVERLKNTINKLEVKRREMHNEIQNLKGNIRVFCRLRPPSEEEVLNQAIFNIPNERTIEIPGNRDSVAGGRPQRGQETQEYNFDRVFGQEATQADVFEELSQLIQSALDGYHVCVFAYGQTGSGKTHTMLGERDPERMGMIPRSVKLIFDMKQGMEAQGWTYKIQVSFLEIYNENVQDLLNIKNGKTLDIRFNDGKGTTVSNLTIVEISTPQQFEEYMNKAQQNRFTAATNYNERSSRSHAVTKIYINGNNGNETFLTGSVSLIDLAGSESAKFSADERLKETKHINKSLTCLGNVLMSLNRKDNHIPYRDSKLTFLLQSSLGGNCKCLMVANISPNNDTFNETLNVLRFANKVKEVKTNVTRNRQIIQTK